MNDEQERLCGAAAEGGSCVLPEGHNVGNLDIPENHQAKPQSYDFSFMGVSMTPLEGIVIGQPKGSFMDLLNGNLSDTYRSELLRSLARDLDREFFGAAGWLGGYLSHYGRMPPDHPRWPRIELFPEASRVARVLRWRLEEARRRATVAWRVLRHGEPDDDSWGCE